jgi:hypothetical protein
MGSRLNWSISGVIGRRCSRLSRKLLLHLAEILRQHKPLSNSTRRSSATGASELIAEIVAHRVYGGSAEDLGRTIHAHLLKNSKA